MTGGEKIAKSAYDWLGTPHVNMAKVKGVGVDCGMLLIACLEDAGLVISGRNPKRDLVEIVEVPNHPYFVACQFHPEFNSRPNRAHPLFQGLINAAHKKKYN